jgi:carbonic anhydrase
MMLTIGLASAKAAVDRCVPCFFRVASPSTPTLFLLQMPVDLNTEKSVFEVQSALQWNVMPELSVEEDEASLAFNGHTVQVNPSGRTFVDYHGKTYELLQFHFHTPSENRVDGHSSACEMHMVHRASDGALLVSARSTLRTSAC